MAIKCLTISSSRPSAMRSGMKLWLHPVASTHIHKAPEGFPRLLVAAGVSSAIPLLMTVKLLSVSDVAMFTVLALFFVVFFTHLYLSRGLRMFRKCTLLICEFKEH